MSKIIQSVPNIFRLRPQWPYTLPRHLNSFETYKEARKRRSSLIRALKRHRADAEELIHYLDNCERRSECRLLCCPTCMRAMRSWLCDEIAPIIDQAPEEFKLVTLLPHRHRHGVGTLHTFNPQHLIDDFRTALKKFRINNRIVFGSIDYCQETIRKADDRYVKVYCPHLHIITNIRDEEFKILDVVLSRYFPKTDDVRTPIHLRRVVSGGAEILRPISYCIKSTFYTRYSDKRSNLTNEAVSKEASNNVKTKKHKMHGRLLAEIACFQASHRFKDRVVLIGLKHVQKSIIITAKKDEFDCDFALE